MNQELSPDTTLLHYRILSKIGAGGMGDVYRAQDTKLNRTVALKILPENVAADPSRLQRFVQEAKAASALNHPNILTVYEIGQAESTHFIATEYIDGETLRQHVSNEPMSLHEVLDVSIQVTSALTTAHDAGIIHRDIKPENIMIRRDGILKVVDFGLAKLTRFESADVEAEAPTKAIIQTDPGTVMGSILYMSPEQARGISLDARTDIFSVGVVLYELVAGCLPFAGSTSSEVMASILSEKEPPPLARYSREAPLELERIVSKALRKNRDERYQTIKDLLLDLKSLKQELEFSAKLERSTPPALGEGIIAPRVDQSAEVATSVIPAQSTSSVEYIVKGFQQHRLRVFTAVAVLLLAATVFGYWFFVHRSSNPTQIESIAVMPFVNESGNSELEYLPDGMTEALINSLSQLPQLTVKARSSVFRYKGKEVEPQQVAKELSVQAILYGRLVQRGDDLVLVLELVDARNGNQLWGETYNRKQTDLVTLQSEIARDVSQKLRLRLTSTEQELLSKRGTENPEANKLYLQGRYYWNTWLGRGYEKSIGYYERAIELDPTYALAYAGLADYYGFSATLGFLPPDDTWSKCKTAINKALALDDTLAEAYNPLAAVKLYYHRDWPAAERAFRRGIELNPNFTEIRLHYALNLVAFGRKEEGLAEHQRALDLEPVSLRLNRGLGRTLFFIRQYDRAIDQLRQTLELDQSDMVTHEWLGDAYEQKGMHKEAIAEWVKALTLSRQDEQASILEGAYVASGFDLAVRALWQKKLERLNEKTKRGDYVSADAYATAYSRLRDKEQALAWVGKAVQERNGFWLQVKDSPIFDNLRDDPRFQESLRSVGFK